MSCRSPIKNTLYNIQYLQINIATFIIYTYIIIYRTIYYILSDLNTFYHYIQEANLINKYKHNKNTLFFYWLYVQTKKSPIELGHFKNHEL